MSQQFPSNPIVGSPQGPTVSEDRKPSDASTEAQSQLPPEPIIQQPYIVDVVASYQSGNYLPLLHCFNHGLITLNFFDQNGYHPLHNAVASNHISVALILLDHFKIDVNIRAKNGQTPLMIAAHYGHIHTLKMICDRGGVINEQEDTRFSALMYTVKQGYIPAFAYLLSQNADINTRDANGCTIVHWAAYKNNVYLLKIFKRLGLDLNVLDFTGMTPLDRAIQSDAFQAVKYLLENGDGKIPPNMAFEKISNNDMKNILLKKYFKSPVDIKIQDATRYFREHSQKITVGIYALLWVWAMIIYVHAVMFQGSNYTFGLVFIMFGLYFIGYSYWYYTKPAELQTSGRRRRGYERLESAGQNVEDIEMGRKSREMSVRMNYGVLNKIVQNEWIREMGEYTSGFPTFLHELAYLMHSENFKEIERFSEIDNCADCLIRRPNRSCHCEEERVCVEEFCHYSYCLGRSVTRKEHYLYLVLLAKQMLLLSLFLVQIFRNYATRVHNFKVFPVEIGYILWQDFGVVYSSYYVLMLVLWFYNTFFLLVELYGVLRNITSFEIFNASKCRYLYKTAIDRKGSYMKKFHNPYDRGIKANVIEYFNRIFN